MRVVSLLIFLSISQPSTPQHLPPSDSSINFASYFCFLLYSKNLAQISEKIPQDFTGSVPEAKQMRDIKLAGLLLVECKAKASFLPEKALFEALQRLSNGVDKGFLPVFFPSLQHELPSLEDPLSETETAVLGEFQASRAYSPVEIAKLFERRYVEVMGLNLGGGGESGWSFGGRGGWLWAVAGVVVIGGATVLFAQFTSMRSQVIEIEELLKGRPKNIGERKEKEGIEGEGKETDGKEKEGEEKEKKKVEGDVRKRKRD